MTDVRYLPTLLDQPRKINNLRITGSVRHRPCRRYQPIVGAVMLTVLNGPDAVRGRLGQSVHRIVYQPRVTWVGSDFQRVQVVQSETSARTRTNAFVVDQVVVYGEVGRDY